jgi:HSP20 family molecular chaperone IbpA
MHRRTLEAAHEQLRALHQALTDLASCLPEVAFSPPLDVFADDGEILVELALAGITKDDLRVEVTGNVVAVFGTRQGQRRQSLHGEIPRGPFKRVLVLPRGVNSQPRVEVENGLVRIHLTELPMSSVAKA